MSTKGRLWVFGLRGIDHEGGVETHVREVYTRLAQRGWDVTIWQKRPYVKGNDAFYTATLKHLRCVRGKYLETPTYVVSSILRCVMEVKQLPLPLVIFHSVGFAYTPFFLRLLGYVVIQVYHSANHLHEKWGKIARWFLRRCEHAAVTSAAHVVCVAKRQRLYLYNKYGIGATYIPNGVSKPHVISLDKGFKYALTVGRLTPEKRILELVKQWVSLPEMPHKLVVVGELTNTPYCKELKRWAHYNDSVKLIGNVKASDMAGWYSNASLFILPGLSEGMPIALLEALSYGLPCFVHDEKIKEEMPMTRDELFTTYSWDTIAEQYEEVFNACYTKR